MGACMAMLGSDDVTKVGVKNPDLPTPASYLEWTFTKLADQLKIETLGQEVYTRRYAESLNTRIPG